MTDRSLSGTPLRESSWVGSCVVVVVSGMITKPPELQVHTFSSGAPIGAGARGDQQKISSLQALRGTCQNTRGLCYLPQIAYAATP